MSYLLIPVAFALGVWAESSYDLSGRLLQAWREWQARQ